MRHRKVRKSRFSWATLQSLPKEAKIAGAFLLILGILSVMQLFSQQIPSPSGLIVDGAGTSPPESNSVPEPDKSRPFVSPVLSVKIISPEKGSEVGPGFDVLVEFSNQAHICYYQVRDAGSVTWDRRIKPCRNSISVEPAYCKTAGEDTCFFRVEAYSQDGNGVYDEIFYSIR